jgi:hypothetical protein
MEQFIPSQPSDPLQALIGVNRRASAAPNLNQWVWSRAQ